MENIELFSKPKAYLGGFLIGLLSVGFSLFLLIVFWNLLFVSALSWLAGIAFIVWLLVGFMMATYAVHNVLFPKPIVKTTAETLEFPSLRIGPFPMRDITRVRIYEEPWGAYTKFIRWPVLEHSEAFRGLLIDVLDPSKFHSRKNPVIRLHENMLPIPLEEVRNRIEMLRAQP